MIKILMVSETIASGVGAYVTQLCNDMCDHFNIFLAYSSMRPETPKDFKDLFDPRVNLIEVKNFGKISDVAGDIKAVRELQNIARAIQPDVIHLHSSIAGGLGRIAFRKSKVPVIYTPHGYAHILMGPGLRSHIFRFAEKVLGNRAITLTCCESEDEEAKKFSKKTAYIETGVNLKDLSTALDGIDPIKNDQFTVFSLGRICVQKQPQVFNKIAELVPEARFLWIGDGELREQLTAPNIEITGWKPRHEALAMAKGADAFVLCSLGEAIAMSLIENMYIKKLCLVSNVMGNQSVIKDGVNGYVCSTPEEYAKRIREAMTTFPENLPKAAYEDVLATYNTGRMKEKFVRFYRGGSN